MQGPGRAGTSSQPQPKRAPAGQPFSPTQLSALAPGIICGNSTTALLGHNASERSRDQAFRAAVSSVPAYSDASVEVQSTNAGNGTNK